MPEVTRVLMTADTVGGVWTFAMELSEALGVGGIEVILATLGGEPSEEQRAQARSISNLRLFTSRYKLEWMESPWADVEASGRWLLDLERQCSPDIIHLNSFGHGALPWSPPVILTAHSCVVSWWAAVRGGRLPTLWNRYRAEVERSLRAATVVIAPSHAMLSSLLSNYSIDASRCRVIYNGRNPDRFSGVQKEPLVFAAGRLWDEAKNLQAMSEVAPSLPWPVFVAGSNSGPRGETVDTLNCTTLGRLGEPEIAQWYARAAIYAAPAKYEPFGLSVLEAALSGCALVLGDIESQREIWDGAAVFVPPGDPEKLASALRDLMAYPVQREVLASRSSSRAHEFTSARMAGHYVELYRQAGERRLACAS